MYFNGTSLFDGVRECVLGKVLGKKLVLLLNPKNVNMFLAICDSLKGWEIGKKSSGVCCYR